MFSVTGVRRLMKEAMELRQPTEMYHAQPMEDNLFEWHFTIRGTLGTDFEGGIYHGRIIFPADYPMKPPNLILLTVCSVYSLQLHSLHNFSLQPNGRFELNKKVCLSISGYHPETWLPSWSSKFYNGLFILRLFNTFCSSYSSSRVDWIPAKYPRRRAW